MKTRKLGTIEVSEIGVGCMGFSHGYGAIPPEEESIAAIRAAYDAGCTFFDTAEVYGAQLYSPGHNERLLGKAVEGFRDKVVLATKLDVPEDPVTGSTHCMIAPYWCKRLGKDSLTCLQASERGGILQATLCGNRVKIAGKAVLFSECELFCERNPTDDRT